MSASDLTKMKSFMPIISINLGKHQGQPSGLSCVEPQQQRDQQVLYSGEEMGENLTY